MGGGGGGGGKGKGVAGCDQRQPLRRQRWGKIPRHNDDSDTRFKVRDKGRVCGGGDIYTRQYQFDSGE